MVQDNKQTVQEPVTLVPSVGSSYGNGWRRLQDYFLELFLIIVIGFIVAIPVGWFDAAEETRAAGVTLLSVLSLAYGLLLLGPLEYGIAYVNLRAARSDQPKAGDILEVFKYYADAVLANILVGAIVCAGLILLIVPGIVFACKLAFTPYLVVDRRMKVIDAVKESWRMTDGYAWQVFFIGLLSIPIAFAGLICFGVGVIVSIMWIHLAFASLYHAVATSGVTATKWS